MRYGYRLTEWGVILLSFAALPSAAHAETLHVNARVGDDGGQGTQARPLKSLERAVALLGEGVPGESATIVMAPGLYSLRHCVVVGTGRAFTEANRLTIRASILPGDRQWELGRMPVIVSAENPDRPGAPGRPSETYSLKVQTSHVTVQGLKFLGNPLRHNWHCCIERVGTALDDLVVTQCLFLGERNASDIYCATLATGDRFIVDHCVFSGCHACTVFWDGLEGIGGKGGAMRYCIIEGASISAIWTCQTEENFEFHGNVITSSEYVWMRKPGDRQVYRVRDCAFIKNKHFSGYGLASGPMGETGPDVRFDLSRVVTEGRLEFASDEMTHLAETSTGQHLDAGLFRERESD